MEDPSNASPPLCVEGCGFYGTREQKNMCSKCYANFWKVELIAKSYEALKLQQQQPQQQLPAVVDTTSYGSECEEVSGRKKAKNRCKNCNKKVGLTGFKCRCGDLFCGVHRYPEEHSCPFDYKTFERDLLIKNNPLIMGEKLDDKI